MSDLSTQVFTVSQINEYIRCRMDEDSFLNSLAIKGEVSNYKQYPSGHHYFSLKDEGAAIRCVMFRGNAVRLRFRPENGMQVIVMGKISVYPRDGAYQLYCTSMVVDGVGDLYTAFEQLKKKLGGQGLFDPSHKKRIPTFPKTIGIITSSAGAAVHDMLRILNKRFPMTKVLLLPVRVQGAEAPGEIAAAIAYANHYKLADVLIVGRGGGSMEDLWAFNDELVAQAIYRSEIPVISAVGHEPDVTISDYVADLRAATPSNAAELVVPDQDALRQVLDTMLNSMESTVFSSLKNARRHLQMLSVSGPMQSPTGYIQQQRKGLEILHQKLAAGEKQVLNTQKQRYMSNTAKLDAMSPLKVLTRGYAMAHDREGAVLRSVFQTKCGDDILIRLSDGTVHATVFQIKEDSQ